MYGGDTAELSIRDLVSACVLPCSDGVWQGAEFGCDLAAGSCFAHGIKSSVQRGVPVCGWDNGQLRGCGADRMA